MQSLTIRRPDDFHVHLREGAMLAAVLPSTADCFGRGLIMPNTAPPILDAASLIAYRAQIEHENKNSQFTPLMTLKLVPQTTPETIREVRRAGAIAAKLYPDGVTTNSAGGVRDVRALDPVFAAMEEEEMVLCLHGEMPGVFSLDREKAFLPVLESVAQAFPRLRVVLEHVSSAEAVETVRRLSSNVAATITVHHMLLTLDDVVGDLLRPHHFCKPLAKRPEDRDAVARAAMSGDPSFFLGTDTAPHARERKECAGGCAGIFTAPVALPLLAAAFEEGGALARLEAFTSEHGARFYSLPVNESSITLQRMPWTVPDDYAGVVPFKAGETLPWRVAERPQ